MKKIILSSVLLLTIPSMRCLADGEQGIKISTATTDTELQLSAISNIKYSEDNMILTMKDGTTMTFGIDEVTSMVFTSVTAAINSIVGTDDSAPSATITVTDLSGHILAKGSARDIAERTDLHGIVIISMGNKSKKVIIR